MLAGSMDTIQQEIENSKKRQEDFEKHDKVVTSQLRRELQLFGIGAEPGDSPTQENGAT